jgi:hypothetical protein
MQATFPTWGIRPDDLGAHEGLFDAVQTLGGRIDLRRMGHAHEADHALLRRVLLRPPALMILPFRTPRSATCDRDGLRILEMLITIRSWAVDVPVILTHAWADEPFVISRLVDHETRVGRAHVLCVDERDLRSPGLGAQVARLLEQTLATAGPARSPRQRAR